MLGNKKLLDIEILRAIAVISVLFYHLSFTPWALQKLPFKVYSPFYAGVELFFVVSGFVVIRSLFRGKVNPAAFLIRRFLRLHPAIFIFILISYILNNLFRIMMPDNSFAAMFRVSESAFWHQASWVIFGTMINHAGTVSYYNGAMWSLSVEFQFYAVVAALVAVMCAIMSNRSSIKNILFIIVSIFLGFSLFCRWNNTLNYVILYDFDFIATGVALALVDMSDKNLFSWKIRRPFGSLLAGALFIVPLGIAATCPTPFGDPGNRFRIGVSAPIMMLSFAALVALAAGGAAFPAKESRLYNALVWVGARSYSIYLFHFPVMAFIWFWLTKWGPHSIMSSELGYDIVQAAATFAIVLPLSNLSYRYVEEPVRQFGNKIIAALFGRSEERPSAVSIGGIL